MAQVVLITGGNLGPVADNLAAARRAICRNIGRLTAESSVRESHAWGFDAEEPFLNQVLVVETALDPDQVLTQCFQIEQALGRHRTPGKRYASRTMDIDILFYDQQVIHDKHLTIPHPRLPERDFVLAPLEEVLPELHHPVLHKSIRQLRQELSEPKHNEELLIKNR